MNKLMMTVCSVALMAMASPVLAQSTSNGPAPSAPRTMPGPAMTAPNNSSINAPQDMAPMSSKGSTSAVAPTAGTTQSSDNMSTGDSQKPMRMHKMHHGQHMDSTKTSGSKSTDNDAEQLNQQELGKLHSPS
jgi:hypothetical protein